MKTYSPDFRDDNSKFVGAGTKFCAGNSYNFMIIHLAHDTLGLLDLNSSSVINVNVDVSNPEAITKQEFLALTRQFNYTFSDWEFYE